MEKASYTVKVEEGRNPSAGHVYRSIYARDGLVATPPGIDSPWQFFRDTAKKMPDGKMLGRRQVHDSKAGPYAWMTYRQGYDSALRIGSAIRSRGVNPGDCCGIYGFNCPEWILTMEGCSSQGITYVPLYDTLGPNAVEFIINHAEISIAFAQQNKIPAIISCLANFANVPEEHKDRAQDQGVSCFSWKEFLELGNAECKLPQKSKSDICTIMYTSGTTGEPKGVIISNEALMAEVLSIDKFVELTDRVFSEEDTYFSFLPLAHIYDLTMEIYCIYRGSSIGFWQGDARLLMEDVQELKPTIFSAVPRVFDRIYTGISTKVSAGGTIRKALFQFAYDYKLRNLQRGLPHDKAAPFMDKLIFEKTKQAFGGRVRVMTSGAAPLPRYVEEFLRVTSCASLTQGYGLTESCGGCVTAVGNAWSMVGTVGIPMPSIEVRLESVPDMGYDALSSSSPRGEICLRGTTLFSGYHKRPDLTNEVIIDGWFRTGDIGEWQPDGSLKIIDRKKNIFKLSQGEYVAVESVESVFARCPHVTSIWVYGNSFESFLVAIVVPDQKALQEWAAANDVTGEFKSLCQNPKARKHVLEELNRTGQANQLRGFEMLKGVHLEPNPFDIERDLITPTYKLKRPQLLKYYQEHIDKLYSEAKTKKA
ncbi:hypothetical protein MLD38_032298 [Melastoma candidum]|uniref:Uncharacterized protein n=1 Tax=Melastoma candidum TaxID=119954 RepID=A0ACB9M5G8_9MYRT|nr:hypothetical protein MLD38_032298 [Melastoma candidum]